MTLSPVLPEGKAALRDFIAMSRRKADIWMQAGHQVSDRLAESEAATQREADQALRERARQLDFERRRVSNLRAELDSDKDMGLSPLSRWGRSRFM